MKKNHETHTTDKPSQTQNESTASRLWFRKTGSKTEGELRRQLIEQHGELVGGALATLSHSKHKEHRNWIPHAMQEKERNAFRVDASRNDDALVQSDNLLEDIKTKYNHNSQGTDAVEVISDHNTSSSQEYDATVLECMMAAKVEPNEYTRLREQVKKNKDIAEIYGRDDKEGTYVNAKSLLRQFSLDRKKFEQCRRSLNTELWRQQRKELKEKERKQHSVLELLEAFWKLPEGKLDELD